jgi:hypothetical protein
MSARVTAAPFVWILESALLSLFGVGTIFLTQSFGGASSLIADIWTLLVILCSCVVTLGLHTLVAVTSKQTVISSDNQMSHLHKPIAQSHTCVVTLMLLLYVLIVQRSLVDLNWAAAYYPASPGLLWLTAAITLSFTVVLFITSVAGAWTATELGDYNSLFSVLPTTCVACIFYPVIHEIGTNGLMVCSGPLGTTLAVLYCNLTMATSFTLCVMDIYEFDPAAILPKFMRTVNDRQPYFRIYGLLHGAGTSGALVVYSVVARKVSWGVVIILLSLNGILTVVTSAGLGRFIAPSIAMEEADTNQTEDDDDETESKSVDVSPVETVDTLQMRRIEILRLRRKPSS